MSAGFHTLAVLTVEAAYLNRGCHAVVDERAVIGDDANADLHRFVSGCAGTAMIVVVDFQIARRAA